MPLSEKQLAANRANSTRSTGPTSTPGLCNFSRNSTRPGILASVVLLEGESRERFAALVNSFLDEFQAETSTDIALVRKMAVAHWRLMRTWAFEATGTTHEMKLQSASITGEDAATRAMTAFRSLNENGTHLDLTSHYEHCFDRQHYRALEAFHKNRDRKEIRAKRSHQVNENKGTAKNNEPIQNPNEPIK